MPLQHQDHVMAAREFTSLVVLFLGAFQIVAPRCFWGSSIYFKGVWRRALPPPGRNAEADRLKRVLDARDRAEGKLDSAIRYAGVFTIGMALLVLVPAVPLVLPYALSCLAMAAAIVVSYLRFRRVTERRVAPLIRRSPWTSLPPIAMTGSAVCLLGTLTFAAIPEFRVSVAIVIASAIALLSVAWRVATAPAILFGDDSQLEYLVDEHLRFCRAMGFVSVACAPPVVLVGLGWAMLPASATFFNVVAIAVALAFLVVLIVSLNPIRKRFSVA